MLVLREEKETQSVPVYVCIFYTASGPREENSSRRARVNVKALLHYADLEELHFVYLDLMGITEPFAVTPLNNPASVLVSMTVKVCLSSLNHNLYIITVCPGPLISGL